MAECTAEDKYLSKGGRCCDRCPPGSFVQADCDDAKKTQCGACGRGLYTATRNHLSSCIVCRQCSASNNQRTAKECTAHKDTVCGCLTGFFCSRNPCEHCMPATICFPGSGVKVQTTGANDTVCAPCEKGTYSNVSDSQSACQMHTRCEDLGRELKTPGTSTTDAICGDLKSGCPWILPAGLWLGFVLTILAVLGLMCWTAKRKSHKTARSSIPVHEVKTASAIIDSLLEPQLPNPAPYDLCQKSDTTAACQFTIFNPDDSPVSDSTEDNMGLPASLKTDSSDHRNGTDVYHRSYSEPQEDEWCGT
ncbi:tumor necrosis factor receptor superfamily member 5 isoform X1 [Dunckerocampus dactyliophorus]|uniref:tumor necrosis factor receptor superfamily member 5 isoform X1 n=1 Tax=Dunckerocampus dactyliophorus TaxID=161453 RepID=UPI002404DF44|nr:tumor necrosis factor receptor superfamily member 5 isoform X1 [Dunckerocampus dactyliophorus]